MEGEGHIIDFKGLFAGARRTSVTGSVIESSAVRQLLHFLPQEQFAKVEARLSSKDVSILAKYSWAIPITPMSCLPKDEVFNALKSPILRHDYYSRMVVGDDFHSVEEVIVRLARPNTNCNSLANTIGSTFKSSCGSGSRGCERRSRGCERLGTGRHDTVVIEDSK
jgi:hypothetical protein